MTTPATEPAEAIPTPATPADATPPADSGPTVDAAIGIFMSELAIGRSAKTVETYHSPLAHFRRFLTAQKLPPETTPVAVLTADHAVEFTRWLDKKNPNMPRTTLATYLIGLARFYRFLVVDEHMLAMSADEYEKLRARLSDLRGRVRSDAHLLNKVPHDAAVARILATAHAVPGGQDPTAELRRLRNIAMLETMRCSGMRVSEVVSLRRGDLVREGRHAVVTGKGDKQRYVYFDDAAWEAIQAYLRARGDGGRAAGRSLSALPLFARHDRGAGSKVLGLTTNTVRHVLAEMIERANRTSGDGLDEEHPITPHSFRHWFATRVLARTGDLAATQDLLGHASPATTRVYARVSAERLRAAHASVFGSPAPPADPDVPPPLETVEEDGG
jgi:site-specific recombinase XerD